MQSFVTFAALPEVPGRPIDLTVDFGDFAATRVRVTGTTIAGQDFLAGQFGAGCVEATVLKSAWDTLGALAEAERLRVSVTVGRFFTVGG